MVNTAEQHKRSASKKRYKMLNPLEETIKTITDINNIM